MYHRMEQDAVDPPRGWTVALTTNRATLSALLSEEQGPRESWLKVRGGSGRGRHSKELLCLFGHSYSTL